MVRLLTLWFDYGHWPEVYEALVEGIKTIQIDTWLQVIPQLIARIDTPRQLVGRLIHQLLTDIGKHHPQVLVLLLLLLLLLLFVNDSHEINSGALEDKEKNELKQCQYLENFIITHINSQNRSMHDLLSIFLVLSAAFPSTGWKSLLPSLRLHWHKIGSVFPLSLMPLSTLLPSPAVVSWAGYNCWVVSKLMISLLASSPWPRCQSAPESLLVRIKKYISVSAQALIYPLTVASKSASSARKNAANQILKNMCEHSHQLVQQAVMVGSFPCLFALCCI